MAAAMTMGGLLLSATPTSAQETRASMLHGPVGTFELPPGFALGKEERPQDRFSVHQILARLDQNRAMSLTLSQQCGVHIFEELEKKGLGDVARIGMLGATTGSMKVTSVTDVTLGGRPAKRYEGINKQRKDAKEIAWVIDYPHGMADITLMVPAQSSLGDPLIPAIESMQLTCGTETGAQAAGPAGTRP